MGKTIDERITELYNQLSRALTRLAENKDKTHEDYRDYLDESKQIRTEIDALEAQGYLVNSLKQ